MKDQEREEEQKRAVKDAALLAQMAELAECASTLEFARKALAGLLAMGLDPEKTALGTRAAASYGRPTGSYLESAAAFAMPGAPMLRAILERGADPDAGAAAGDLTPLMHAVSSRSMPATLALAEAGADWTRRVTRGIYARQKGLGQSPAERLLQGAPWRSGMEDPQRAERDWERACGMAIEALAKPGLAEAGLAALVVGDEPAGALTARLMKKLERAGASGAGGVVEAASSGWPAKSATPARLAAHLAGQGEAGRLAQLLSIFPKASEPESMKTLLAAVGMGMICAGAEEALEPGGWLSAKESSALAKSLASSSALESLEIKAGRLGPCFATALGAMCRPKTCPEKAFGGMCDFWGEWIQESEAAGQKLDAAAAARALAAGAAGAAPLNLEKDRGSPWPSREELAQTLARAERAMAASPGLALEAAAFKDAWALAWAGAAEKGPGERAGAKLKKGFASFLEGLGEELEGWAPRDQGLKERVWESLANGAAKAAEGLKGGELARLERFSALAASAAPAKASGRPQARI